MSPLSGHHFINHIISYHIISYHMRKHFRTQMCEITVIVLAEHKAMYHHRQGLIFCTSICFTIAVADPRHATSCAQGRASCHSEVNYCHSLVSVLVIFALSAARSLGALQAPTSRLWPFRPALGPSGLLDNVLQALWAFRPCREDPV